MRKERLYEQNRRKPAKEFKSGEDTNLAGANFRVKVLRFTLTQSGLPVFSINDSNLWHTIRFQIKILWRVQLDALPPERYFPTWKHLHPRRCTSFWASFNLRRSSISSYAQIIFHRDLHSNKGKSNNKRVTTSNQNRQYQGRALVTWLYYVQNYRLLSTQSIRWCSTRC